MLLTAIKEINEITDLTVELIDHKEGRRVVELQFRVFRKHLVESMRPLGSPVRIQASPVVAATGTERAKQTLSSRESTAALAKADINAPRLFGAQRRIEALGVSTSVAERICNAHGTDLRYLQRHLDYVEARIRNTANTPLVDEVAFLQKALTHGYGDVTPPPPTGERIETLVAQQGVEAIGLQQAILRRRAELWQRFQSAVEETQKMVLIEAFLQQTRATLKTFYKKNCINNMIVKTSLTDWLFSEKLFLLLAVASFLAFAQQQGFWCKSHGDRSRACLLAKSKNRRPYVPCGR